MQSIIPRRLLSDTGLRQALAEGRIAVSPALDDKQIQPASLDVRIGEVRVFSNEVRQESLERIVHNDSWSLLKQGAVRPDQLDQNLRPHTYLDQKDLPILIPSGAYAEVFFHEDIRFSSGEYMLEFTLRSSRGRLILQPSEIHPYRDDYGRFFIGVHNFNPNDIILRGQDRIAQLIFSPAQQVPSFGSVINKPEKVEELLPDLAEYITEEGYVVFNAGDHALKYKQLDLPYDTGFPAEKDKVFEKIDLRYPYRNSVQEALIVSLQPKVKMPDNVGIMLQRSWPIPLAASLFEAALQPRRLNHMGVNAGWIDPGYEGSVSAHPMRYLTPSQLVQGQPVVCGVVYEYIDDVERAYGSEELDSHYQGSDGATESRS